MKAYRALAVSLAALVATNAMAASAPTTEADQIQAALIGGEITLPNGATTMVRGSVASAGPVATR